MRHLSDEEVAARLAVAAWCDEHRLTSDDLRHLLRCTPRRAARIRTGHLSLRVAEVARLPRAERESLCAAVRSWPRRPRSPDSD